MCTPRCAEGPPGRGGSGRQCLLRLGGFPGWIPFRGEPAGRGVSLLEFWLYFKLLLGSAGEAVIWGRA